MPDDKDFELDDLEAFSLDDLSLEDLPEPDDSASEDPFGVWVKGSPEDVVEDNSEIPPENALADLPDESIDDDFLSSEELADLDDAFEFVTIDGPEEPNPANLDDLPTLDDVLDAATENSVDKPVFDEVSLDDFVSFDDDETPSSEVEALDILGDAVDDVGLDGPGDDANPEAFLDIDIDVEDDVRDEDLEIFEGAAPAAPASNDSESANTFVAEEIDLSEFGDFEEIGPEAEEATSVEMDDLPEVVDVPDLGDPGFFEEHVLDEVLPGLEPEDSTDLEHLQALEKSLTGGIREADKEEPDPVAPKPAPVTPAIPDVAAQILAKLETELSSIKQEISELKREVTNLRPATPSAPIPPAIEPEEEPLVEEESVEIGLDDFDDKESHGFFDDEDDETIALTGDELNTLLSSAEISEGEVAPESLEDDLLPLESEDSGEVHVSDEEFLAGTSLDVSDEAELGIPESIELEETEDLLSDGDLDIEPLPEGVLEGVPTAFEIPDAEEWNDELGEIAPLAPELAETLDELGAEELPLHEEIHTVNLDDVPWADAQEIEAASPPPAPAAPTVSTPSEAGALSPGLKDELRAVLSYMDKLLASLPDDKIQEFAESEHFEVYKKLFEELGLVE